ncbi:MAG TPA: DUF3137 domain-containing protein [Candidatus Angelobacter sp.]|nr:DUF3137 domain-containing protein [Candidatus Angelobacter sp.]
MGVLRTWFGPSRKEIWQQFCAQTGSNFVEGGFWKSDKVEAAHNQWTVTLDLYVVSTGKSSVTYTRMRAPYVNPDSFRFTIYRKGIFTEIGKWFGMQDVTVGYEDFDRDFVIQGNDEQKLRKLFSSQKIRDLIAVQPDISFSVKDDEGFWSKNFPEEVDELYFQVVGVIKDVERLKLLYDLFAETLDELCRMGSAYEQAPPVKL